MAHFKRVLITGATGGLGREIAKYYAQLGSSLILVARDPGRLRALSDELGPTVSTSPCNLANRSEVQGLFDGLSTNAPELDLVVNSVGAGTFGPLSSVTEDDLELNLDANLRSLLWVSQRAITNMTGRRGLIVNVLSSAARVGRENEIAYCISKWAARGLTEALQSSTKGTAIRIMAAYPGGMNTGFWQAAGYVPKALDSYMNPSAVARVIVDNIEATAGGLHVGEFVISRLT